MRFVDKALQLLHVMVEEVKNVKALSFNRTGRDIKTIINVSTLILQVKFNLREY